MSTALSVDQQHYRAVAFAHGAAAALTLLHAETSAGVLPAGPGGHVFVPEHIESACDRYETPDGPRARDGAREEPLGGVSAGLVALRIRGAGPTHGGAWPSGVAWVRLGLAERLLGQATEHLRHRTVQQTATLNLPLVRAMLADAAGGIAEAAALFAAAPGSPALHRIHRSLDEVGRLCLHLFGAVGFLATGPGGDVRASELLADAYTPERPEREGS
ncbi:hypothetical protein [Allorhizocola rhizosphaerae]|uniref:hypothetical protein n=1 Tax=Allorhizocola rhizosphaerae TaxID=1872709 RepID=UPI000E3E6555|nr:hypothetical protein [Allorhizocola rhizosphaerae]